MLEPIRDDDEAERAESFRDWTFPGSPEGPSGPEPSVEPADVPADAGPESLPRRPGRARLRIALGAILILAGVAFALVPRVQWHRTLAPVRRALTDASAAGLLYPEARPPSVGTASPVVPPGGLPSGFEASMDRLRARFDRDPRNPEVAYWLGAGYTVSGRLEKARAAVDIARVHNTHERRLWILDAILAAREGDPGSAREILKRFLVSYPGDELATRDLEALE